jgi:hypothetical protein
MQDPGELGRALTSIAAAFEALGVRWAIGGSLASAAHGEPRATNDIDVIALLDEPSARTLAALLGPDFYADTDAAVDAVRAKSCFNVIDKRSFLKIDIFVPALGALGVGQLDRRRFLDVFPDAGPMPVLGPEDVVLQKLRWYRLGGEVSDRQWRDIVAVLRQGRDELDEAYLDGVAGPAGLDELLERARRNAT